MSTQNIFSDVLATLVYPGLAAVSLFWTHIGIARLIRTRRLNDALWVLLAGFIAATFILLTLSTGLFVFVDFLQMRLAIRLGWLVVLILSLWLSIDFMKQQHEKYQRN